MLRELHHPCSGSSVPALPTLRARKSMNHKRGPRVPFSELPRVSLAEADQDQDFEFNFAGQQ